MEIIFKDQPNGKCFECIWNKATGTSDFWCSCPATHLTNHTCILKCGYIESSNIAEHFREE